MARSLSLKLPRRCLGSSGSSVGFTRCQSLMPPSSASSSIGVSKTSKCLQVSVSFLTVELGQMSPKEVRFHSIIETQMGRNLWRALSSLLHRVQLLLTLQQVAFVHPKPSKSWKLPQTDIPYHTYKGANHISAFLSSIKLGLQQESCLTNWKVL